MRRSNGAAHAPLLSWDASRESWEDRPREEGSGEGPDELLEDIVQMGRGIGAEG